MGNSEVIAGLIAGPLTTLIAGIVKAIFGDSWEGNRYKKSLVFTLVMVICGVVTAAIAAVSGDLTNVRDLAGMYAVALATSQIVFRYLSGHHKEA